MAQSQTLLQMTQEILQAMQSESVSSIDDNEEATAVAYAIRRAYWDLFVLEDFPETYSLFKLTETTSSTPTLMTVPTNVMKLEWVRYNVETASNTDDRFVELKWLELDDFLDRQFQLVESSDSVSSFSYTFSPLGSDPVKLLFTNNRAPQYYTTPDDYNLLFDSYDSGVETYLKAAKTIASGIIDSTFTLSDAFTPDLDARQFSLLLNEAKALCFAELKQSQNASAERQSIRLRVNAQRTKRRVPSRNELNALPNYGRK